MAAPGCTDLDGDGYGIGCAAGNDCNDRDPASSRPVETCNFKDDNCNGLVDEAPGCVAPALDSSPCACLRFVLMEAIQELRTRSRFIA